MTETATTAPAWDRRKWITMVLGILGAQIAILFLLSERSKSAETAAGQRPFLILSRKSVPFEPSSRSPGVSDPTLFSLVHPRGFSAEAWLRPKRAPHQFTDWTEPDFNLGIRTQALAGAVTEYLRSNATPEIRLTDRLPSAIEGLPELSSSLPVQSTVRVVESTGGLRLIDTPQIRPWFSKEPLQQTLVRATIDERGEVMSTTLLSRSGDAKADQRALGIARSMRFTKPPATAKGQGWLTLEFRWATIPPATNAVPEKP
ncbi:MAG TPA: hypothetical protein VK968_01135 [Roseimicrobium sp.]|nr:hypothetical protein [Roseimicrobium sp.]